MCRSRDDGSQGQLGNGHQLEVLVCGRHSRICITFCLGKCLKPLYPPTSAQAALQLPEQQSNLPLYREHAQLAERRAMTKSRSLSIIP
jgi:hypothetical protein